MHTREKIVIINALHRNTFYKPSLERSIAAANLLNGPEYILVNVDFETTGSGMTTLERVAQLTATAEAQHQPSKIYQCVDYNEGNSGSPDTSIPNLAQCNGTAGITTPIIYILDGSNAAARQRDEQAYGFGDYRFIMKFITGLKSGLAPAPSPSPTPALTNLGSRSTSAPPAPIAKRVNKTKPQEKTVTTSTSNQASGSSDEERKETETEIVRPRSVSAAAHQQTNTHLALRHQMRDNTIFNPGSNLIDATLSSAAAKQRPEPDLVRVDITYSQNGASTLNPLTVNIIPLVTPSSNGTPNERPEPDLVRVDMTYSQNGASTLNPLTVNIIPLITPSSNGTPNAGPSSAFSGTGITLPTPPAAFTGNYEYPSDQLTPTHSGQITHPAPGLFTNHLPSNRRLHSPTPRRTTLSPIVSRAGTPDQRDSNTPSPSQVGSHVPTTTTTFNTEAFLAGDHSDSPRNSPLLGVGVRTLGFHGLNSPSRALVHGRNSPFNAPSPAASPSNSPNSLFRRLQQRPHSLAHTHFGNLSLGESANLEEGGEKAATSATTNSGEAFKITQ